MTTQFCVCRCDERWWQESNKDREKERDSLANVALSRFRVRLFSPLHSEPFQSLDLGLPPCSSGVVSRASAHGGGTDRTITTGTDQRSTHPWPIFSKRVYFFLGSPTLTMLPETQRKPEYKNHWVCVGDNNTHGHMYALSHRNRNRKSCIFISYILFPTWHNVRWVLEKCGRMWAAMIDVQTGRYLLYWYIVTFNNFCFITEPFGNM